MSSIERKASAEGNGSQRLKRVDSLQTIANQQGCFMFLNKAFSQISEQCPKKDANLQRACKKAHKILSKYSQFLTSIEKKAENTSETELQKLDKTAGKLVTLLQTACLSRQSSIVCLALDCFQKMMVYGYIRGNAAHLPSQKKLIEVIVDTISACFDLGYDSVQLQILKALLTAVAESSCELHDSALMASVRTCYNIYLVSQNTINQVTAKATLDQMLDVIFQRMERSEGQQSLQPTLLPESNGEAVVVAGNGDSNGGEGSGSDHSSEEEKHVAPAEADAPGEQALATTDGEKNSAASLPNGTSGAAQPTKSTNSVAFTDCFLIFRSLCKLSNKELPDGCLPESLEMRSKTLSLELLLGILEKAGPVFRTQVKFINTAIKKYLCPSIGTNATSPVPHIFGLSLDIFIALINHFKDYLKEEIGIYFTRIFLKVLESNNSTTKQKAMVLQALLKVCNNPQTLVDIFLNYDCSLDSQDVFGRMVNDLSSIAKGTVARPDSWTAPSPTQGNALKTLGLECLVTIMKSMVNWSKEIMKPNEGEEPSEESDKATEDLPLPTPTDDFEKKKQLKQQLQEGIEKFNINPTKGIQYLEAAGILEHTPESVAKFLKENNEKLDKYQIGQYFGKIKNGEFNKLVLYAYTDLMTLSGLPIDLALRQYLYGFRLPGEGQQIDRIVEKFASRYIEDNPDTIFASANAAYLFSYSMIMLATDLHSPSITKKITKEQWKKNHENLNDSKDLPGEFQDEIYDRLAATPFKLAPDDEATTEEGPLNPKQKELRWIFESKSMAKRVQQLLKKKLNQKSTYEKAIDVKPVRPMFEVSWCPMLAAFSVLLETSEDNKIIDLCLLGFKCAIHVSAIFYMETVRNTFVSSLAKFTHLTSVKEIRHKNIASIKTLITIAHTEGDFLQDSWREVLHCISKLDQMLHLEPTENAVSLSASNIRQFVGDARQSLDVFRQAKNDQDKPSKPRVSMNLREQFNSVEEAATLAKEIEDIAIDRVFTDSARLSDNAIVDFVQCLCDVSWDEIESANPRMFSLQKLVEVAHYNMGRIRIVWSRIWAVMGKHMEQVGCHQNLYIAIYAINSLKQLAMRFLAKTELANFQFQKDFLKPFENIITHNPPVALDTRDMIIQCLSIMIRSRADNIKSGWKSIFVILSCAANDRDEKIVQLAFEVVEEIMKKYFEYTADSFFVECVNCLVSFGKSNLFKDISLKAIDSLVFCSRELAQGTVCHMEKDKGKEKGHKDVEEDEAASDSSEHYPNNDARIKYWFPVLTGFSEIVGHPHIDVRTVALEQLFHVLKEYGINFNTQLWDLIFRGVILPIFIGVRVIANEPSQIDEQDNIWITTTCLNATQSTVDLLSYFFNKLSFLLDEILVLLASFIMQDTENLAEIGCHCLQLLIMRDGHRFDAFMWNIVCSTLVHVVHQNTPSEVFSYVPPKKVSSLPRRRGNGGKASRRSTTNGPEEENGQHPPAAGGNMSASGRRKARERKMLALQQEEFDKSTHKTSRLQGTTTTLEVVEEGEELDIATPDAAATPEEAARIKLLRATPHKPPGSFSFSVVNGKCAIHLLLMTSLNDLIFEHYERLSAQNILTLLGAMEEAYTFAYQANNDPRLRKSLGPTGVMARIIKIEISSLSCIFRVLFRLVNERTAERRDIGEEKLIRTALAFIQEFRDTALNSSSSYAHAKVGLVVQFLEGLLRLGDEQFDRFLPIFYQLLVELLISDRQEIRRALQPILLRVGTMHIPSFQSTGIIFSSTTPTASPSPIKAEPSSSAPASSQY
ncbi:Brefeldin A-inhibited guanine nucleotide-exchange protein 1 [Balamuthia mandrillaris]